MDVGGGGDGEDCAVFPASNAGGNLNGIECKDDVYGVCELFILLSTVPIFGFEDFIFYSSINLKYGILQMCESF